MEKEGIGTSKLSERLICLENGVVTDRNFGKNKHYRSVKNALEDLCKEVFKYFDDKGNPKIYEDSLGNDLRGIIGSYEIEITIRAKRDGIDNHEPFDPF